MKYIKDDKLPIDVFLELSELKKEVDFWHKNYIELCKYHAKTFYENLMLREELKKIKEDK